MAKTRFVFLHKVLFGHIECSDFLERQCFHILSIQRTRSKVYRLLYISLIRSNYAPNLLNLDPIISDDYN